MDTELVNREIEKACLVAFPTKHQEAVGSWYVRCSDGNSRPSNTVHTDAETSKTNLDIEEKIAKCEAIYKQRGLNSLFRLTHFSDPELESILIKKGYKADEPSCYIMSRFLNYAPQEEFSPMFQVMDFDSWFPHFFEAFEMNGSKEEKFKSQKAFLKNLFSSTLFGVITDGEEVYSCGYGVITGNLCGLFALGTKPKFRNQGYGKQLNRNLLDWAVRQNAQYAYLQVDVDNYPALGMYKATGFEVAYPYKYFLKKFDS